MCMCFACVSYVMYVWTPHTCLVQWRSEESVNCSGTLCVLETEPRSSQRAASAPNHLQLLVLF